MKQFFTVLFLFCSMIAFGETKNNFDKNTTNSTAEEEILTYKYVRYHYKDGSFKVESRNKRVKVKILSGKVEILREYSDGWSLNKSGNPNWILYKFDKIDDEGWVNYKLLSDESAKRVGTNSFVFISEDKEKVVISTINYDGLGKDSAHEYELEKNIPSWFK